MNKYLYILTFYACSLLSNQATEYKPIHDLSSQFSMYVEPTVSVEVEAFVQEVAQKIGYRDQISVVHPTEYAQETYPAYKYIIPKKQNNLILFINKHFFDSLTEQERFYQIALMLMNFMNTPEKESYNSWLTNFNRTKNTISILFGITSLAITGGTYYYITKNHSQRFNAWYKKLGASIFAAAVFELLVEKPIDYLLVKKTQVKAAESAQAQFNNFLKKFDCLDAGISATQKYIESLKKESNAAYWAPALKIYEDQLDRLNKLKSNSL